MVIFPPITSVPRSWGLNLKIFLHSKQGYDERYQIPEEKSGNEANKGVLMRVSIFYERSGRYTGVDVFIGSKVQCLSCFETWTTEGRGAENEGSAILK